MHDKIRHEVEEGIRVLKSQRGVEVCHAGYRRPRAEAARSQSHAQEHHIALCLVADLIVERERLDHGVIWRRGKRHLILTGTQVVLPALARRRKAAQVLRGEVIWINCGPLAGVFSAVSAV